MLIEVVRSLRVGRFLEWAAVGVILVFCANRVFEIVGMDVGEFSISCWFKTARMTDDIMWFFTGVYEPSLGSEREGF